jgi:AraC family transcriptional regulator, transcriptional activator of pobA
MQNIPVRKIASIKDQDNSARFSIREVQQMFNGKNIVHDLHRHDFFFILALQKGTGIHEIDFIPYQISDHSVFILRPGQVHRLEINEGSTGFLIEFAPAFYQPKNTGAVQRWKKSSAKNFCKTTIAGFVKLHSFLANIFNEYTTKQDGFIEAISANLDLFFIEYIRQSRNPQKSAKSGNGYFQDRFDELVQLLEDNIASMKNVSQYADLLNISSYQLNAVTKSSVGKTVSDLINEQIILEAKRHLLATSNQVKDIADQLGYEDVSYFIRFFKKNTGHTPEAFRRNFK